MHEATSGKADLESAAAAFLADPAHAAVMLDLDGTLAEIVDRPDETVVAERLRAPLARVAARFGLVAIVTGRPALRARAIVGLDGVSYAGNHGFEILAPGAAVPRVPPTVQALAYDVSSFVARLPGTELEQAGIRIEDKGAIFGLHWRGAPDEAVAEARVMEIAERATERGLITHRGRKVMELRPDVPLDKGTAVTELLEPVAITRALYAGDDRTDLDAFAKLATMRERGSLTAILRVGVRSAEGPKEIVAEADLVVDGPAGLAPLLEALAG